MRTPLSRGALLFAALSACVGVPDEIPYSTDIYARTTPPGEGFTIAVLPDTQIYTRDAPELFRSQTQWIADVADDLNIAFVIHEGDIVQSNQHRGEWEVAEESLAILEHEIPYVLTSGNHDLGPTGKASTRDTLLNEYFPVGLFARWTSFGGTFEDRKIDNNYHVFETNGIEWLVVALEFAPRDSAIDWADQIISAHYPMPTIVVTHAYLYSDDTLYDHVTREDQKWSPHDYGIAGPPGAVNDGQQLWDKLIKRYDSIQLVLSGHVLNDGVGRLTSRRADGSQVHQLVANYQMNTDGGEGYLRLMHISADGRRVTVQTFSPHLGMFKEDVQNSFELSLGSLLSPPEIDKQSP